METDNLLRQEKNELRKKWTNGFLLELDILIEKCFLKPKEKKEHFITQEKVTIELLKLLQSQKKFQPATSNQINLQLLAVFVINENKIGKIKCINVERQEVEYIDMFGLKEIRPFHELILFDIYSPELQLYFERQKRFYDSFSYKDVFGFLTYSYKKEEKKEIIRMSTPAGIQQIKLESIDYSK
jgi:hypothetical protein